MVHWLGQSGHWLLREKVPGWQGLQVPLISYPSEHEEQASLVQVVQFMKSPEQSEQVSPSKEANVTGHSVRHVLLCRKNVS